MQFLLRFKIWFWIVLGLHLLLIRIGLLGLFWFVFPRLALGWYCWRAATLYGASCTKPGVTATIASILTLVMTSVIMRTCYDFARKWRLYLKPTVNEINAPGPATKVI